MSNPTYKIVRTERKSIALVIDNTANLVVRAPNKASDNEIANYVEDKKRWINEKQHHVSIFGEKHSSVIIETGESIMYLGNSYTIILKSISDVQCESNNILIPSGYTKEDLILWLKAEAKTILSERVTRYASLMGTCYPRINITEARARWGSCGNKGNLNFAWRLIMCPMSAIDYVVVHELSHIVYKNHNSGFWARVKTVIPNYREQQDWLHINQNLMQII